MPSKLFEHWSLFVGAMYLLLKDNVHLSEVALADQLLRKFVGQTEVYYLKVSMTFNVHLLFHLAQSVYDWGPLWSRNTYAFESENGNLLNVIHAAKGIHHQICRRISLQYSALILKDRLYPDCSYSVQQFFDNVGTTAIQKTVRFPLIRYFGPGSSVNEYWTNKLCMSSRALSYSKIVKNGCLYMSCTKINKRSDNCYAILFNGSYAQMKQFVVDLDEEKEFSIVRKIDTKK